MEATVAGNYAERELDDLVEDMKFVRNTAAPNTISWFSFNLNYYKHFMDLLATSSDYFKGVTLLNERLDVVANAPDQLALAKKLGLKRFSGAIEGMGERVREKILNKNLPKETLFKAVEVVSSLGLMHMKCLVPDTKVFSQRGIIELGTVQVGDKLWDGEQWVKVLAQGVNNSEELIGIRFYNGAELKGLPDHKVMTNNGWKELSELTLEDAILVNSTDVDYDIEYKTIKVADYQGRNYWQVKKLSNEEFKVDESLGALVGWISGDGNMRKNRQSVQFCFSESEHDLSEKLFAILSDMGVSWGKEHNGVGCFRIEVGGHQFRSLIDQLIEGQSAKDKVFSSLIMGSPKSVKRALLKYLFSADGTRKFWYETYGEGKIRAHKRVQFSSFCEDKLEQVRVMLNEFGIRAKVSKNYLDIYTEDIPKYMSAIGFVGAKAVLSEEEQEILYRETGRYNNIEFSKVVQISSEPAGVTVAIETESHKYVANGTITHNCGLIATGQETEEDIQDFITEIDEMIAIRDRMGANHSYQFNVTPLVLYSQIPLRYLPRVTAKNSYLSVRNMQTLIQACQERSIRIKFNG
jgi:intein/homing endonuclease